MQYIAIQWGCRSVAILEYLKRSSPGNILKLHQHIHAKPILQIRGISVYHHVLSLLIKLPNAVVMVKLIWSRISLHNFLWCNSYVAQPLYWWQSLFTKHHHWHVSLQSLPFTVNLHKEREQNFLLNLVKMCLSHIWIDNDEN